MLDPIAGNGLLPRRAFLGALGGAAAGGLVTPVMAATGRAPGPAPSGRGEPAPQARLERENPSGHPLGPAAGSSSTPLQSLNGTLTPNALHFERHHSGIPTIEPTMHRLTVHGDVARALQFDLDALLRYPMVTRTLFLECSGNSYRNTLPEALDLTAGALNGLVSTAEWTGVPLHAVLDEAGFDASLRETGWVIAEGADASANNRSLPMPLALDGAMIALYQNGEPLRPAQGYPMRLLVPGCEGNLSIKWLKSLRVQPIAAWTREETSKYTDLLPDGRAHAFSLRMGVKSVITAPSGTMQLPERGIYAITGMAWSGHGAVRRVEVSADGGVSWAEAELQSEPGPLRPTRFRIPWRWNGGPAVLLSRAVDDRGHVQPSRSEALARYSPAGFYHYNGMQSWSVDETGRVRNVHV
ncbi:MAG: sulfite dehydrogenase [Pseudomonadales bacterium]|jgi:sulfane dehydrogenase subunit SoxC|nr:sulfite dehydrogenase [Pseudomonadales bacterium]